MINFTKKHYIISMYNKWLKNKFKDPRKSDYTDLHVFLEYLWELELLSERKLDALIACGYFNDRYEKDV